MSMLTMSPDVSSDVVANQSRPIKHWRKKHEKKNWLCDRCGSVYLSKESFIQHMLMHTCPSDKPYKCEFCHLGFHVQSALKSHRRVHRKSQLKCDKCDIVFTRKHNYLGHMLIHEGKEPFKCDLCGDEFAYKCLLKYHMRTHTGEYFACKICDKQFFYKSSRTKHMQMHYTTSSLTGKHCQKSNENEGIHVMHSKFHEDRDQCECRVCEIMRRNGKRVKKRPAPHHFGFLKLFSCTECNMKFYSMQPLSRHMESKHKDKLGGIKVYRIRSRQSKCHQKEVIDREKRYQKEQREKNQFVCSHRKCKARFLTEEMLNTHKSVHTHKNHKIFTCGLCSKEFTINTALKNHMMEHSRMYVCEICDAVFQSRRHLQKHKREHFTQETHPYSCSYCDRLFKSEVLLKAHLKRHSTICKYCSLVFPSEKDLENHLTICIQANRCNVCDATFGTKSLLENHLLLHEDKEYLACQQGPAAPESDLHVTSNTATNKSKKGHECRFCDISFLSAVYLAEHVKEKHKDNLFKCGDCDAAFRGKKQLEKHVMAHIKKKRKKQNKREHKREHFTQKTRQYSCSYCDRLFKSEVRLRAHLKRHSTICKYCSLVFPSEKDLENHLTICIQANRCNVCDATFGTKSLLENHLLLHEDKEFLACQQGPAAPESDLHVTSNTATNKSKKGHECRFCDISFLSAVYLAEHVKEKHKDNLFKCGDCDAAFRGKKQLEKHVMAHIKKKRKKQNKREHKREHFTQKTRQYSCSYCDRLFKSEVRLRAHLKRHSTICKYCSLEFPSEKDLENHLTICIQANRCNVCDATFGTKSLLENHLLLHEQKEHLACQQGPAAPESDLYLTSNTATNEGKEVHECDFCDISFLSAQNLAEHVKEKHQDDLFKCGHCKVAFRRKQLLEKHVMTHIEKTRKKQYKRKKKYNLQKPFQCDICKAQFSSKVGLLYHQRVHKGNIQLNCQQCNAKFSDVEEYVTHQSTHGDLIKPLQCGYCDISFDSEDFFTFHIRTCKVKKLLTQTIIKT